MENDEEHRHYGDSTILEPILEQQDDEVTKIYRKELYYKMLLDDDISDE